MFTFASVSRQAPQTNADESSYSYYYGLMAPRSFNAAAAHLRWSQTIPAPCGQ